MDAPVVYVTLFSERLKINKAVELLIDTGSSRTTLLDNDAIRLGLDYSQLQRADRDSIGIGGIVETYVLSDVRLTFLSDRDIHTEVLDQMFVLKHDFEDEKIVKKIKILPSLLGRDILDKYTLVVSKKRKLAVITDEEVQLPKPFKPQLI